jgi:uncharacterized membrane-anchored protein YhcB (DUF1043 family)
VPAQTIEELYQQAKVKKEKLDEKIEELVRQRDSLEHWLTMTSEMIDGLVVQTADKPIPLQMAAASNANQLQNSNAPDQGKKPMDMLRPEYQKTDQTFAQVLRDVIEKTPGLKRDELARKVYQADLADSDFKRAKGSLGSTLSDKANSGMWQKHLQKYYPAS